MTAADTNHHPPHSRDCVFVCVVPHALHKIR